MLTPRAERDHLETISSARRYRVWPNEITDVKMLATVGNPGGRLCDVEIDLGNFKDGSPTTIMPFTCQCAFAEEHSRPCGHVIAAASSVRLDVWGKFWFGECWWNSNWKKQHQAWVPRPHLQPGDFFAEDVRPARLCARPGRKRKRPYEPSNQNPRICRACGSRGHFTSACPRPNVDVLIERSGKSVDLALRNYVDLTLEE